MTGLLLAVLALLLVLNAMFVAAEFALVRARRHRLQELSTQGYGSARIALSQVERLDEYLSACQVGITMTSIGIGFLGEPAVASLLEPILGKVLGRAAAVAVALLVAYVVVTSIHISLGEQVPKIYAIQRAEATLRWVARPLGWFRWALGPLIWVLNHVSNAVLRLLGVEPDALEDGPASAEELRRLIADIQGDGKLDAGEAGMLSGVFRLHEQEARQVMTPTPAVVSVDLSETVGQALRRCLDSGHTRLVVTEGNSLDRVRGLVHQAELTRLYLSAGPDASFERVVRTALMVPETKPLDDLLAELQSQRAYLAVVIDEYGRVSGVVSVEDIVEEIVGEINDEYDRDGSGPRQLANGEWLVPGHVSLADLHDQGLMLPVDSDAYNSLGGLLFDKFGRVPERGEQLHLNGFRVRVEQVTDHRIELVRIRHLQTAASQDDRDKTP